MRSYNPKVTEIFDSLSANERDDLRWMLDYGLTLTCAEKLLREGLEEEADTGSQSVENLPLPFTKSAVADLDCFENHEVRKLLEHRLRDCLAADSRAGRSTLLGGAGWLVSAGQFRIVLGSKKSGPGSFVAALAAAGVSPLTKIWRYFDQDKAEDLLTSIPSSLYCSRLDQFPDPQEGKLPYFAKLRRIEFYRKAFGAQAEKFVEQDEQILRGHTYASCWTLRKYESHLAWKNYCPTDGGLAIQTTWRRVAHLHQALKQTDEQLYCRDIGYLNPQIDDLPNNSRGEEVFWKAHWFSDETEIRFVLMQIPLGTDDDLLKRISGTPPENRGRKVPCDLALLIDQIVINPFSSSDKERCLRDLAQRHHPHLVHRIRGSEIKIANK